MAESFDVIVIGGGPGGYVAAIRAAQLGKKTAVVERDKAGGRCLNYACIPAKTLLRTAEIYDRGPRAAPSSGSSPRTSRSTGTPSASAARRSPSRSPAASRCSGRKTRSTVIEGEGSLDADGNVKVGDETYEAGTVVLATGSVALPIPGVEFGDRVLDTWGAWSLPEQPKKIAVVGAGASGSEIASAYGRFGTEVLLIEMLDQILPAEDKDMARVVERAFKKQGIDDLHRHPGRERRGGRELGQVHLRRRVGRGRLPLHRRRPRARRRGPRAWTRPRSSSRRTARSRSTSTSRTSNPKVYAIGDLVNAKALAHKASEEGVVAVEHAAGVETHPVDQNLVAGATFCHPQVASVGLTEAAAKEAGHEVKVGKLKLGGVGGATVYDDKDGLVKLVVDSKYGEILGAHIVGNRACDMIAELVATMALEGGYQELARIVHPHPTISEAILDAARAVDGWAIHA